MYQICFNILTGQKHIRISTFEQPINLNYTCFTRPISEEVGLFCFQFFETAHRDAIEVYFNNSDDPGQNLTFLEEISLV